MVYDACLWFGDSEAVHCVSCLESAFSYKASGRLVAVVGVSGGPLIVSATLQTLARWDAILMHASLLEKLQCCAVCDAWVGFSGTVLLLNITEIIKIKMPFGG
jgi:hypothetical protein